MALGSKRSGQASGPSTPPRLVDDADPIRPAGPVGASPAAVGTGPAGYRYPPHLVASGQLIAASGVIKLDPVPSGELWELELCRVSSDSATTITAALYVNDVAPNNLLDSTQLVNGVNVLEGTPPWRLPAGAQLVLAASNGTIGAWVYVRAQVRVITVAS